jgi:hypothetical protein
MEYMNWQSVRGTYLDQWLIIEALSAYTALNHTRVIERISVIEQCADGTAAFTRYRILHQQIPEREFYFVHTSRTELDIPEVQWLGVRRLHEAYSAG